MFVCICIYMSLFSRIKLHLIQYFSFSLIGCHNKANEPCLRYYLSIAGWIKDGFLLFPRVLG